ncbi:MAG: acetolactate decarboxylase [Desulfarculaceae bacterium]|jgi:acetolactate decarboxylase
MSGIIPIRRALSTLLLTITLIIASTLPALANALYQVSTIDALLAGVYDGNTTFAQLAAKGDMGLGTFNRLDGEMIALDGRFYRVRADGKVYKVGPKEKTPFANVARFKADQTLRLKGPLTMAQLTQRLDKELPTPNLFYALRLRGRFAQVKARSVPGQKRPYPKLVEVVKKQSVFKFTNISGDLMGFRCPAFVKGVNVVGYHLHFLSQDRQKGGHVLGLTLSNAVAEICHLHRLVLDLPAEGDFARTDLGADRSHELEKVEK